MWGKMIAAGLALSSLGAAYTLWPWQLSSFADRTTAVMAALGVLVAVEAVAYLLGVRFARHALLHGGVFCLAVAFVWLTSGLAAFDPGLSLAYVGLAFTGAGGWFVQRRRGGVNA